MTQSLSDVYLVMLLGLGFGLAMCITLIFSLAAIDFIYRLFKGDYL